ncbi:uncharacterized protein [Cicer arietinum]|uniref:Uncharacterized protein LOC101491408 n=1 Tax=Cicer arietinum TaxID=3827 RepID=A0A1S2XM70_CICAR|nr:uncharacterized protein LOC101491408 [Cicer arietinum]
MGREKTMKCIQNEKARKSIFMQRNKGLTNKISTFSTMFGAEICLIMYNDDCNGMPITFPQDTTVVQSMVKHYKDHKIETTLEEFDIKDYFTYKKNLIEAEISKVRKEIFKKKYPIQGPIFHNSEEEKSKSFVALVDSKIQTCNHRINMLKNMQQRETNFIQNMTHESIIPSHSCQVDKISQMQSIDPIESLNDDTSEMVDFKGLGDLPPISSTNQLSKIVTWDDLLTELKDDTDFIQNIVPDISNDNFITSYSSHVDVMHSIPQMEVITDPIKQLNDDIIEMIDLTYLMVEHEECATQLVDLTPISTTTQHSKLMKWNDLLVEHTTQDNTTQIDDWGSQLDDYVVDWISQPDIFAWQDISFL